MSGKKEEFLKPILDQKSIQLSFFFPEDNSKASKSTTPTNDSQSAKVNEPMTNNVYDNQPKIRIRTPEEIHEDYEDNPWQSH